MNYIPCQADGYGQPGSDHASSRTEPDNAERLTGIYGSDAAHTVSELLPGRFRSSGRVGLLSETPGARQGRARGVPDRIVIGGGSRSLTGTPRRRSPAVRQVRSPGTQSLHARGRPPEVQAPLCAESRYRSGPRLLRLPVPIPRPPITRYLEARTCIT
jgi:hypothetical protein